MDTVFTLNSIQQNQQPDSMVSLPTFKESFQAMQQVIIANYIVLQEKMDKFLEFIQQQHNNISAQSSTPPEQNYAISMMYLCAEIYRYFYSALHPHESW